MDVVYRKLHVSSFGDRVHDGGGGVEGVGEILGEMKIVRNTNRAFLFD